MKKIKVTWRDGAYYVSEPCWDGGEVYMASDVDAQRDELLEVLERYMAAYPAFRIKPEGAPGSPTRVEQERLMALEDCARVAIAKATSAQRSETSRG